MSAYVSSLVWPLRLTSARKILALRLADNFGGDGRAKLPSVDRLARDCGLSPKSVRRALSELETAGLIAVDGEFGVGGRVTMFEFDMTVLAAMARRAEAAENSEPER